MFKKVWIIPQGIAHIGQNELWSHTFLLIPEVDWSQNMEAFQPQADPQLCSLRGQAQMNGADLTVNATKAKKNMWGVKQGK